MKRLPVGETREVRFGRLCVSIDDIQVEVEARAKELATLADRVEFRKDCEAVLEDSDVEVYRIAALLGGGLSPEEVRADYPSLSLQQLAAAKAFAEAYPKPGRPYPKTTFKRALSGAGLEALVEVLDG